MKIHPIKTKADYEKALARIEALMDAKPGTPKGDELDVLTTLIEHYEDKHYPVTPPNPIEAILFRMEQGGFTRKDLEPYLGGRGRVSEVLNGTRPLSLNMIRGLHAELGIPLESLIGQTRHSKKKNRLFGVWKNNPKARQVSGYVSNVRNGRH
ncbi:MAG: transcriptional regulator [Patescibacteria group bacterium]